MKMRYDHEDDVLMIWLAEGKKVDHAEHVGQSILHVTENNEPVFLEILSAREFVLDVVRSAIVPAEAAVN
ncbi:DUF2283 domain-containing protein [bacterium]|nr:DUF2283 domain-containing protein [bacterium]